MDETEIYREFELNHIPYPVLSDSDGEFVYDIEIHQRPIPCLNSMPIERLAKLAGRCVMMICALPHPRMERLRHEEWLLLLQSGLIIDHVLSSEYIDMILKKLGPNGLVMTRLHEMFSKGEGGEYEVRNDKNLALWRASVPAIEWYGL